MSIATGKQRLVERLHNRQRDSRVLPGYVNADELAELESRLRRLHAMGASYAHVRLSAYVAPRGAAESPLREGASCVAKDV